MDEELSPVVVSFLEDNGIDLIRVGEDADAGMGGLGGNVGSKSWQPIPEDVVLRVLSEVVDGANYPVMVTDTFGKHRTGLLIACLRKLQRWSLASIFEEYRRFAGSKRRLPNEQFIELFDIDLVHVPSQAPSFLLRRGPEPEPNGAAEAEPEAPTAKG